MPIYIYKNEKTEEYVEVFQGMNEPHTYSEGGVEYKRVFTIPNMSIDSMGVNPYSQKDFLKASNKKMTVGEVMDLSTEMSESRAEKEGEDPIKRDFFKKYEKETKRKHLKDIKAIDTKDVKIEF